MQESGTEVIVLLIVSTIVVLILVAIIMSTLVISQKRKFRNRQKMEEMRSAYEREILKTQLEIQTQTFESISRELHDNVGVLISLASVNMKTMPPRLK
jgi:glucose-6-phosphate-specific signal transduction histidine kinase